jgi:DNA-binding LytR/AlgR family response regulator
MRIVIVEDERPAREKLASAILEAAPEAKIVAGLTGVAETVEWLENHEPPDLLFLDIQLSDGRSFEILRRTRVSCPVVFATAYDEFLLEAFASNGIDYLLKPVRQERVGAAIEKYRRLRGHFIADHAALLESVSRTTSTRERLLVRKGIDFISVKTSDIAYVFTAGKLVFLVAKSGLRYVLDRPLAILEAELDGVQFFRANRAYLVHIESVVRCRAYGKGKLLLELKPVAEEDVIVSQERAPALRDWLGA